jgi:esterase/lipase
MLHQKTIFIIPGFKQYPTDKAYKEIAKFLKNEGYYPIPVTIPWRKSTISQNTNYFLKKYIKIKANKKYVLGFSYGAMIALIASTKVSVSGLILCSLSPYFKEDIPKINKNLSSLMAARYEDFSKLHCKTLTEKTKAKKILMLYGAEEAKSLIRRVTETFDQISSRKKHLIKISEASHKISDEKYLNTIYQAARDLL